MPCFWFKRYRLGLPPWDPDTKDFSGKVLWNPKSFTKIKWYFRCEVLLYPFLRKKGVEKQ